MASLKIVALAAVVVLLVATNALPVPDSAGIVEMPNGLAYGGIPYGSVSGSLAASQPQAAYYAYNNLQADASELVADTRTVNIASPIGY